MLTQIPERQMHWVRWVLTSGWLLLIASLLYDPWTSALTEPDHPWSPLRLTDVCIKVQGKCLPQEPYAVGATLFWGAVVPSGIFILLVFGHELWRRICPLSFLSQIPRALGWQRQFKRENPKTIEETTPKEKICTKALKYTCVKAWANSSVLRANPAKTAEMRTCM